MGDFSYYIVGFIYDKGSKIIGRRGNKKRREQIKHTWYRKDIKRRTDLQDEGSTTRKKRIEQNFLVVGKLGLINGIRF